MKHAADTHFISELLGLLFCLLRKHKPRCLGMRKCLRKKPLENVFGHFCSCLIMPRSSGFPFETYVCEVWCPCLYSFGSVCGEGGENTLFLSRPGFHLQSRCWCLCYCATEGTRSPLVSQCLACGGARPPAQEPGRCPPPPVLKPLRRGWKTRVLPCLVLLVCPWAGSACVCTGLCVSICLCKGRVVGRK